MAVFVLDKRKKPLMPTSEKRARQLLEKGKAVVHKLYPFTIRLKERVGGECQPLQLKIDPGSKFSGLALVREKEVISEETGEITNDLYVLNLFQLNHRGHLIHEKLVQRAMYRKHRRQKLHYRPVRFLNRTKPKDWLAPSIQHRVESIIRLVDKLRKLAPITTITQELVRFDTQKMDDPEISGVEYQQGELFGYDVKEYLLLKFNHQCAYCGVKDKPLEIEHIHPRSKGGTNRVSNLAIACVDCNRKKDSQSIDDFLKNKPEILKRIKSQLKRQLKDAAAVNTTRQALFRKLEATGLPVSVGSGGLTKFNRKQHDIPKTHALDALCVGKGINRVYDWKVPVLEITCMGRVSNQRTQVNKYGFPRGYYMKKKSAFGFQTGDIVRAEVITGKKNGRYFGRITIRATGSFDIKTNKGPISGVSYKYCKLVSRNDGYRYQTTNLI